MATQQTATQFKAMWKQSMWIQFLLVKHGTVGHAALSTWTLGDPSNEERAGLRLAHKIHKATQWPRPAADACPGCGCLPGEGYTPGCSACLQTVQTLAGDVPASICSVCREAALEGVLDEHGACEDCSGR